MKKWIFGLFFLSSLAFFNGQELKRPDFKNMTPEQRKAYVKQLPPEQRKKIMEESLVNMTIRNLMISTEQQEPFKKLYKEYKDRQWAITSQFKQDFNAPPNNDLEAQKKLTQSFDLAQQLLNHRKIYTDKFLKILTPQQVLRLFSLEKKAKEKLMEKRPKKFRAPEVKAPEEN